MSYIYIYVCVYMYVPHVCKYIYIYIYMYDRRQGPEGPGVCHEQGARGLNETM